MRIALTLALILFASPALAGVPVSLRPSITDADGVVTLGDIFEGAGAVARTPVATRSGASVMLSAVVIQAAARRAGLDWPNAEGLRQIVVLSGASSQATATRANVDVLTWARSISAGEIIQPEDLVWGKAAVAPADAPSDPDAIVGLAARRALRSGAPIGARDVAAPMVVKANEAVTLLFEEGGVSLSLQAKAMSGGAVGETISVQNPGSKKIIQAVVAGPGQALVGPAAERLKSARHSRIASR